MDSDNRTRNEQVPGAKPWQAAGMSGRLWQARRRTQQYLELIGRTAG